mmetsp:Transcript_121869/g.345415  ORF Transcript_121869/g.345415 Transcript_121869/m.345415 type:complete len:100 (+) Transcript_121869:605-904(+)
MLGMEAADIASSRGACPNTRAEHAQAIWARSRCSNAARAPGAPGPPHRVPAEMVLMDAAEIAESSGACGHSSVENDHAERAMSLVPNSSMVLIDDDAVA